MYCEEFEEKIGGYLDEALAATVRREFASHLLACRNCRQLFDEICDNIELLRRTSVRPSPVPETADLYFLPPRDGQPDRPDAVNDHWPVHSAPGVAELRSRLPLTVGEMVSCRAFDVIIGEYFEAREDLIGSDRPEWIAITTHLAGCSECAALFSGLRLASEASTVAEPRDPETSNLETRILAVTRGVRF